MLRLFPTTSNIISTMYPTLTLSTIYNTINIIQFRRHLRQTWAQLHIFLITSPYLKVTLQYGTHHNPNTGATSSTITLSIYQDYQINHNTNNNIRL